MRVVRLRSDVRGVGFAQGEPMAALIDTTLRDGVQAHWSGRLKLENLLPIALSMDRAGFQAADFMAPLQFEICVKFLRENPWQRIRAARRIFRNTPLITHIRSRSLSSFNLVPLEVIKLFIERVAANGFRRIMVFDALHDIENMKPSIRFARDVGMHVACVIFYTISPFHTDEYYGQVAAKFAQLGADSICLRDPSGLLTIERTRTLIPILRGALPGIPLELKSHCTTGLAPSCYIEALKVGVDAVFTASMPLANGPSVPSTETIMAEAARANIALEIDESRVRDMAEYFANFAHEEGRPVGKVVERPAGTQYQHQVPGGMIAFLRDQLRELGQIEKLPAVLEEIPRVREEFGYPVMVTPVSQLVGVQAVLNVLHGRYVHIPAEVRKFLLGQYGTPEGPLDSNLVDRVTAEAGRSGAAHRQQEGVIERVRRELGPFESDDDLLLHIMFHRDQLSQISPYGDRTSAVPTEALNAALKVLEGLAVGPGLQHVHLSTKDFRITLNH